jgi:hypothetical protein
VARDPVWDLLGQRRLDVSIVRRAQDGREKLNRPDLAGVRIDDR